MFAKIIVYLISLAIGVVRCDALATLARIMPGETPREAAAKAGLAPVNITGHNLPSAMAMLKTGGEPYVHVGGWNNDGRDYVLHANGVMHLMDDGLFVPNYTLGTPAAPASLVNPSSRRLGSTADASYARYWQAAERDDAEAPLALRRALRALAAPENLEEDALSAAKKLKMLAPTLLARGRAPISRFEGDDQLFTAVTNPSASALTVKATKKKHRPKQRVVPAQALLNEGFTAINGDYDEDLLEDAIEYEGFGTRKPAVKLPQTVFFVKVPIRNRVPVIDPSNTGGIEVPSIRVPQTFD